VRLLFMTELLLTSILFMTELLLTSILYNVEKAFAAGADIKEM